MKSNIDIICFPIVWNGILGYIVGTVLGVRSMMHSYFPNQFQALLLSSITVSFAKSKYLHSDPPLGYRPADCAVVNRWSKRYVCACMQMSLYSCYLWFQSLYWNSITIIYAAPVTTKVCTWHDSHAVVPCASFCRDWVLLLWVKAIWLLFEWCNTDRETDLCGIPWSSKGLFTGTNGPGTHFTKSFCAHNPFLNEYYSWWMLRSSHNFAHVTAVQLLCHVQFATWMDHHHHNYSNFNFHKTLIVNS